MLWKLEPKLVKMAFIKYENISDTNAVKFFLHSYVPEINVLGVAQFTVMIDSTSDKTFTPRNRPAGLISNILFFLCIIRTKSIVSNKSVLENTVCNRGKRLTLLAIRTSHHMGRNEDHVE